MLFLQVIADKPVAVGEKLFDNRSKPTKIVRRHQLEKQVL